MPLFKNQQSDVDETPYRRKPKTLLTHYRARLKATVDGLSEVDNIIGNIVIALHVAIVNGAQSMLIRVHRIIPVRMIQVAGSVGHKKKQILILTFLRIIIQRITYFQDTPKHRYYTNVVTGASDHSLASSLVSPHNQEL